MMGVLRGVCDSFCWTISTSASIQTSESLGSAFEFIDLFPFEWYDIQQCTWSVVTNFLGFVHFKVNIPLMY